MPNCELHTDQSFFKDLAGGCPEAFTIIFNQWFRSVYYFAARFINETDAEDIAANIFQKLWIGKKQFESMQHLKSFLFTSTRNACLDYLKTSDRRSAYETAASGLLQAEETGFEEHEFKAELMKRITKELDNLPPQTRQVFTFAFFKEESNTEIAKRLSISEATVRNQKSQALKILRLGLKYNFLFFMLQFIHRVV